VYRKILTNLSYGETLTLSWEPVRVGIAVQRLLREKASGLFLRPDGGWTSDYAEARWFESIDGLLQAGSSLKGWELEEYLMLGESLSDYDMVIPIFGLMKSLK
jgi:hypothetical protein